MDPELSNADLGASFQDCREKKKHASVDKTAVFQDHRAALAQIAPDHPVKHQL